MVHAIKECSSSHKYFIKILKQAEGQPGWMHPFRTLEKSFHCYREIQICCMMVAGHCLSTHTTPPKSYDDTRGLSHLDGATKAGMKTL
jgi:hypothetical protein